MGEWGRDRVGSALNGTNPTVLAELDHAFVVIGDTQFLPGYCVALTKVPGVDRLSDLPRVQRLGFLADVDLLATAVETACRSLDGAFRRVNIEILGDTDPFLHAHVLPATSGRAPSGAPTRCGCTRASRGPTRSTPSDPATTTCGPSSPRPSPADRAQSAPSVAAT